MEDRLAASRDRLGGPADERSTLRLIRDISRDIQALVGMEVQLARQEVVEAVTARLKAAVALAVAGVARLLVLVFLGLAAAAALDSVLEPWASRLVVAGGFLLLALLAAAIGMARAKRPLLASQETRRTLREDVEWAKRQLKR